MILQALVEYYEALSQEENRIPMLGWSTAPVSFALNISPSGELLNVVPTVEVVTRGKKEFEKPKVMTVPERLVKAGAVVQSNFLCESSNYFLGFDDKGKPERAIEYFYFSKKFHQTLLENCDSVAALAVKAFFETWQPEIALENSALIPYLKDILSANLVFKIDGGIYAHEDSDIRNVWQEYKNQDSGSPVMRCLVTGKKEPIAILHGKIKGVSGAQSVGANLVSFNNPTFESYGKHKAQGLNSPIGKYAMFAYTTALNHLIADSKHKRIIGDTTVVYWSEQADPKPQQVFSMFAFPEPEQDAELMGIMKNLAIGKPIDNVDLQKRFYVLGLAPNAARLSVRFFLQDGFGNILNNLRKHYERLEIVKSDFDNRNYLSIPALLSETVNPNSTNKASSPLMSGEVLRSVLLGTPYPQSLYQAVLVRIKAEQDNKDKKIYKITRGRVAIIKAILLQSKSEALKDKEMLTMALNEQSNNRAYVLGRLFAVLEDAQRQANPGINSTIKDRYFTSACATPASVFPQLFKLSIHHTSKAEYGKSSEIMKAKLLDKLEIENNPLPNHLPLNDQGIFILGYYHQVQSRFHKKEEELNGSN